MKHRGPKMLGRWFIWIGEMFAPPLPSKEKAWLIPTAASMLKCDPNSRWLD